MAEASRRKKRMSSQGSGDDSKKPRGRPRVDAQDETAQDRRRTQIRLAQRAYRQRKETTIASLQHRERELKHIIESMHDSFNLFNDNALSAGLSNFNPLLAQDLRTAALDFARLMKNATDVVEIDEDEEQGSRSKRTSDDDGESSPSKRSRADRLDVAAQERQQESVPIMWGYEMVVDSEDNDQVKSTFEVPREPSQSQAIVRKQTRPTISSAASTTAWQSASRGVVAPPLDTTYAFDLPYTFSFNESTFARRLHRATLERGFHLISENRLRPETFRKMFRLSLLYGTRDEIREKMKFLLHRSPTDTLEWAEHPFLQVGGAGTHFPRRDINGNIIPKLNSYAVRSLGPHNLARLVHQTDNKHNKDLVIDLTGYEGEWLDPNDVEGYLREKGVMIEPQAVFVQAEIASPDEYNEHAISSSRSSSGSPNIASDFQSEQYVLPGPTTNSNAIEWLPAADDGSQAMWDYNTAAMFDYGTQPDFGESTALPEVSKTRYIEKTQVTVDVSRLVEELIKRSVCLGRSPGFRRRDVDAAFSRAIAAF